MNIESGTFYLQGSRIFKKIIITQKRKLLSKIVVVYFRFRTAKSTHGVYIYTMYNKRFFFK